MKRNFTLILSLFLAINIFAANDQAKYVFFFIGDGMGLNQVAMTEMFKAQKNDGKIGAETLCFTQFPYTGLARTYSTDNSITDSAAGGTALATGKKTKNGTISMDREHKVPLKTIAERAKEKGKAVGIMTSVSVDHATPASFYAHTPSRSMYYEIGSFIPGSQFDFFAGSGFLSPDKKDDSSKENLFDMFNKSGYKVIRGIENYQEVTNDTEKVILIQKEGKAVDSFPFAIDREDDDMSVAQITEKAIDFLAKKNKGFFMMVEGGKIDWSSHSNDAGTTIYEVMDMDEAVCLAYEFYKQKPDSTLIVVTADHETGGLGLGVEGYTLSFNNFASQKMSQTALSRSIFKLFKDDHHINWHKFKDFIEDKTGLWDDFKPTEDQEKAIKHSFESAIKKRDQEKTKSEYSEDSALAALIIKTINRVSRVGWTSNTHTASYVPVYAIGVGADKFTGIMENTDVPNSIAEIAGY